MNTQVSKHFKRGEFACKCGCGMAPVDIALVAVVQAVRDHFGASVTVTSGSRCEAHNEAVGGSKGSYHKKGMACDIQVKGVTPADVYAWLCEQYPCKYGFMLYKTFVHIDVRTFEFRKIV